MRGTVSSKLLSFVDRRHINIDKLNKAITDIINRYNVLVRTIFLLEYISEPDLRRQITAVTNKVEAYQGFAKWFFFGGDSIITTNNREEMEKRIKYNDLVANAVIFHNVVDLTNIFQQLKREGYLLDKDDVAALSPYLTSHIKRFGDYLVDFSEIPPSLTENMLLSL
jgi:TnpA family transposase